MEISSAFFSSTITISIATLLCSILWISTLAPVIVDAAASSDDPTCTVSITSVVVSTEDDDNIAVTLKCLVDISGWSPEHLDEEPTLAFKWRRVTAFANSITNEGVDDNGDQFSEMTVIYNKVDARKTRQIYHCSVKDRTPNVPLRKECRLRVGPIAVPTPTINTTPVVIPEVRTSSVPTSMPPLPGSHGKMIINIIGLKVNNCLHQWVFQYRAAETGWKSKQIQSMVMVVGSETRLATVP